MALVRTLVESGLNNAQITERLNADGIHRTYKGIQRLRDRQGWRMHVTPSRFSLDAPATLKADKALLLFDIHAPLQAASWIDRVIALALKWKVDSVGVGGDIVDYSSMCYWGRTIGIELDDELDAAENVVRALERNFKQKVLCGGNHEYRMVRALQGARKLKDVLDDFVSDPTTITTNSKWFWLESGDKRFRVVHPRNYSRIPTRVAQTLCAKYRCHIIAGHSHLWGMTRDVSDGWWAIDAGCCLDDKRVPYMAEEMSTYPQPILGAVIVIEGVPILLGEGNIELYERIVF